MASVSRGRDLVYVECTPERAEAGVSSAPVLLGAGTVGLAIVATTVRVPPNPVTTGPTSHLLPVVLTEPVFLNAPHSTVHAHVCSPEPSVSNSMLGQSAAALMVKTSVGFGLRNFIVRTQGKLWLNLHLTSASP